VNSASAVPWLAHYRTESADLDPPYVNGLDMFNATLSRRPDEPLLYYFERAISARTVDAMSDALAVAFEDQGLGIGDRVAMYLQNVPEAIVTVLAAWKCGAVIVPCNPMLRGRELKKILIDSGSRVLVCHDDLYADVAAEIIADTAIEKVFTSSPLDLAPEDVPDMLSDQSMRPSAATAPISEIVVANRERTPRGVELTGDDVALMVYTSGTTGAPKGATNTHRNVVFAASVYEQWLDISSDDVILGVAPLFHVTGLIGHISLAMLTGAPLILFYRFDSEVACRLAERLGATFTVSAVTAFIALLNSDAMDRYDLSRLHKVYTGGAPTPQTSLREWEAKAGSTLNPMYGLTEATSPTHMTPFGATPRVDQRTGVVSVGLPVFGTHVRVIGEDGQPAEAGEVGELYISGPQIVPGYWQKPKETADSFTDGELHTGDVGFMDEDGWFYLIDRAKDMIVASGFKVWPREVEDVLYEHPAILEVAVIGIPDAYRGENVKAVVSLKPGQHASETEIKAFARERMAAYKYPRVVEIVDHLPKNSSGKILRNELRTQEQLAPTPITPPPALTVSYAELRQALEARAVIELGVSSLVLRHGGVPPGRAVGLYERLQRMLAQVHVDGRFIDRDRFLDENDDYHRYLIDLADNRYLTEAFDHLDLRRLLGELLLNSEATSEEVVLQHERLTDALAAGSEAGAAEAIIAWSQAADRHVKLTMRDAVQQEPHSRPQAAHSTSDLAASVLRRAALIEAFEAHAAIEIGVIQLLAKAPDREQLRAVLVARAPLVRGARTASVEDAIRTAFSFHRTLVGALGNPVLIEAYESLGLSAQIDGLDEGRAAHVQDLLGTHQPLLEALAGNDASDAIAEIARQSDSLRHLLFAEHG